MSAKFLVEASLTLFAMPRKFHRWCSLQKRGGASPAPTKVGGRYPKRASAPQPGLLPSCTASCAPRSAPPAKTPQATAGPIDRVLRVAPARRCQIRVAPQSRRAARIPLGQDDRAWPFPDVQRFPARVAVGVCPARKGVSCFTLFLRGLQDAGDGVGELCPARTFRREPLLAGRSQAIYAHTLLVLGNLPVRSDPLLALQSVE